MNAICIFCGSGIGTDAIFEKEATKLGEAIANQNITLVYGGAAIGLMGAVADGALSQNGKVIGVIPTFLQQKEIAHGGLTELITVETMHERKAKMHQLSDGFIALPGGFGTMEELFEILTWGQLQLHKKPIGLLNIDGFYDAFITLTDTMAQKGFLKPQHKDLLIIEDSVEKLFAKMNVCQ